MGDVGEGSAALSVNPNVMTLSKVKLRVSIVDSFGLIVLRPRAGAPDDEKLFKTEFWAIRETEAGFTVTKVPGAVPFVLPAVTVGGRVVAAGVPVGPTMIVVKPSTDTIDVKNEALIGCWHIAGGQDTKVMVKVPGIMGPAVSAGVTAWVVIAVHGVAAVTVTSAKLDSTAMFSATWRLTVKICVRTMVCVCTCVETSIIVIVVGTNTVDVSGCCAYIVSSELEEL
jgi:hypothetical protein